jgi:hypothetical protein
LTCVNNFRKVTYMVKIQVYLRKEELDSLRMAAARSGRSVAELVRDAIRKTVLKPQAVGPIAIWGDDEPKRTSIEHVAFTTSADAARGSGFRRPRGDCACAVTGPTTFASARVVGGRRETSQFRSCGHGDIHISRS